MPERTRYRTIGVGEHGRLDAAFGSREARDGLMMPARYAWHGGTEALLRFGPPNGPLVIAAMPLFEEANRTRAFVATILRALAGYGIAGALPDLPGSGESLIPTEDAALGDWRAAFSSAAEALRSDYAAIYGMAIRGGALVDTLADLAGRYHVAPASGTSLVRDMLRSRLAAAKEAGERFDVTAIEPPGPPIELAGNHLSRKLIADLTAAVPGANGPIRTVRLETDPLPADRKLPAAPLWRRAEPGNDCALATLVADDVATWIAACAG